jgi:hypothetical protein
MTYYRPNGKDYSQGLILAFEHKPTPTLQRSQLLQFSDVSNNPNTEIHPKFIDVGSIWLENIF